MDGCGSIYRTNKTKKCEYIILFTISILFKQITHTFIAVAVAVAVAVAFVML